LISRRQIGGEKGMMSIEKCLLCPFVEIKYVIGGRRYVEINCLCTGEKLIITKCPFEDSVPEELKTQKRIPDAL